MQKGVVAGTFRSDKLAGLNFGTARKHIFIPRLHESLTIPRTSHLKLENERQTKRDKQAKQPYTSYRRAPEGTLGTHSMKFWLALKFSGTANLVTI
jgi:hypothetical protein